MVRSVAGQATSPGGIDRRGSPVSRCRRKPVRGGRSLSEDHQPLTLRAVRPLQPHSLRSGRQGRRRPTAVAISTPTLPRSVKRPSSRATLRWGHGRTPCCPGWRVGRRRGERSGQTAVCVGGRVLAARRAGCSGGGSRGAREAPPLRTSCPLLSGATLPASGRKGGVQAALPVAE